MKMITAAIIFAFSIMVTRPALAAPCDKTDNECLLRLTLQQTYALEAAREENKMLRDELEEERNRSDNRAWVFIAGGLTFIAFFGMTYTFMKKATE